MVNNDNDFFEEPREGASETPREETREEPNIGLSAGGNSYGEESRKREYDSNSIIAILLAVGIGMAVAAVVVALVSPRQRHQRNVAVVERPAEPDEMRRFIEEREIIAVPEPAPAPAPVPAPPPEPVVRERAPRPAPAAPVAQPRPAPPRPVPAEVRLVERPSPIRGEVMVERDRAPAPAAAPVAVAAAVPAGPWMVQIASGENAERTEAEWGRLVARHGAVLAGQTHRVIPAEVDGRQVFRLRVVGFASLADANAFCARFQAAGGNCFATR